MLAQQRAGKSEARTADTHFVAAWTDKSADLDEVEHYDGSWAQITTQGHHCDDSAAPCHESDTVIPLHVGIDDGPAEFVEAKESTNRVTNDQ